MAVPRLRSTVYGESTSDAEHESQAISGDDSELSLDSPFRSESDAESVEWADSPGEVDGVTQWSERVCGACGERRDVTRIVVVDEERSVGHEPVRVDLDCGHSVEPLASAIGHNHLRGVERRSDRDVVVRDRK